MQNFTSLIERMNMKERKVGVDEGPGARQLGEGRERNSGAQRGTAHLP
jgi:hypothetical protein